LRASRPSVTLLNQVEIDLTCWRQIGCDGFPTLLRVEIHYVHRMYRATLHAEITATIEQLARVAKLGWTADHGAAERRW